MTEQVPEYLVETPLGGLRMFVRVNGQIVKTQDLAVAQCQVMPVDFSYHVHIDQKVKVAPEPKHGVMFRCSTRKEIRQLTFECRWEETAMANRGRPESDKGINALRWTAEGQTVLVGTEDAESLQGRVTQGKHITQGLGHCLGEITPELDHLIFGYKDDGFIIRLTEIPANEVFQLYFMVTWGTHPEPSESEATWMAMDAIQDVIHSVMDGIEARSTD